MSFTVCRSHVMPVPSVGPSSQLSALAWIRNTSHVSYSMSFTCRASIWMLPKFRPAAVSAGLSLQLSVLAWIGNTAHVFYCMFFTCPHAFPQLVGTAGDRGLLGESQRGAGLVIASLVSQRVPS